MKVLKTEVDGASVRFTMNELDAMRNGLNEARLLLKGREGADFETRVGMSVEEAGILIKALQALITDVDDRSGRHYSEPQPDERAKITK